VSPGAVAPCGALLGALTGSADEPFDAEAFAAGEVPAPPRPVAVPPAAAALPPPTGSAAARRPVAPAARALARKLGIDADAVPGSGPGGRVTREDVEAFAAARERLVPVAPGVALEVLREGQGEPLLLIPGFGADASSFALLAPRLVGRCHVLAMNPRGVGASDGPAGDVPTLAADAAALVAAAGAPAHVLGASLGAAAALELALTRPELLRSLTLVTPFVTATPRLLAAVTAWCRVAREASPAALAHMLAPLLFSDALLADESARERTLRGLAAACARVPLATLERTADALAAWSGTRAKDLGRLTVRTRVVAAGADLLTPDGEAIARAIPGARLVVVPGAGHALATEAPAAIDEALAAQLGG
jgi:pimeloyl-ACP methyl ester carboxylesterase